MDLSHYMLDILRDDGGSLLCRGRASTNTNQNPSSILVAISRLEHSLSEFVRMLEQEFALRAELDSAWAARPIALVQYQGRSALAFEDLGGEPLDRVLETAPFSSAPADLRSGRRAMALGLFLRIAVRLASAVGEMHRRGIIHKNLKPANVLVNASTDQVWLTGFTDPPNVDGARETVRRTLRDGNRASEVVKRLRALFNKKPLVLELIGLNEAAREVIALLWNGINANHVVLQTELAGDLPYVQGDRVQLQQVILNLIQNAIDSMTAVDDRVRQLLIKTKRDEDDQVCLAVTGLGLAPDAMERMFEANYTTKSNGMGVGLAIGRSIIEGHLGRLWAETNDGPGVTFSFTDESVLDVAQATGSDFVEKSK